MRGGFFKRSEISERLFPRKDMESFGKLVREIHTKIKLWDIKTPKIINSEIVRGLDEIARRLESGHYVNDSKEEGDVAAYFACKDISNINPRNLQPFDIPELSDFGDGLFVQLAEDSIWVPKRLAVIIDHPFFQRLRNISQLDYVPLIYPDGQHNRFSHSCHTYSLVKRALLSLLSDVTFRLSVNVSDIQGALLYALLHDIGHYPLSHMFEDIRDFGGSLTDRIVSDEDLFKPMIEGGDSSPVGEVISAKLAQREGLKSIKDLIIELYGTQTLDAMYSIWTSVMENQAKKSIHWVLAGLMSSPIDVDKISYLKEDSIMTGVDYGRGIDIQGYLYNLKMPPLDLDPRKTTHPVLALRDKGYAAAESIIMARYWMLF